LHPWPNWDELEIGYVLGRDQWGRGLAREAGQM
jgi:RimJ/RimL family protein N-acetyltransferase